MDKISAGSYSCSVCKYADELILVRRVSTAVINFHFTGLTPIYYFGQILWIPSGLFLPVALLTTKY